MKIKPFLRWAGGKQNLVDQLLENTPEEKLIQRYYEPFLGAGSLYFANGFNNAIISDINPQLINSYYHIKDNFQDVHSYLDKWQEYFLSNKSFYYEVRKSFNTDKEKLTAIQAARFIFLIHTNYNGMYRVNKQGGYNVPIGRLKPNLPSLLQLKEISSKLQEAVIRCSYYDTILTEVECNDLVYLDPPYPPFEWTNPQNQYTVKSFSQQDHEKLAEFAQQLVNKGAFVLISYPDIEFVRKIYKDWNIQGLDAFRSINCKKERFKISELIIKNY